MNAQISVVVPAYRRPDRLARCLAALAAQTRLPDEVIVVCRDVDPVSRQVALAHAATVEVVTVPGVLAAMRAGARRAGGELIAFVDDDAEPAPGWVARMLEHLADPQVGGAGGRDIVADDGRGLTTDVGRVDRWGRLTGNHHRSTGPARDVDVLKAANMAFRREALSLPEHLLGEGAQVHFEIATCLAARNAGWRLVMDPTITADHYAGPRFDDDARGRPSQRATFDSSFNLVLCLGSLRPELLYRRAAWGLLVGDRGSPGVARAAVALAYGDQRIARRFCPSVRGQVAALRRLGRGRPVALLSFPTPGTEQFVRPGTQNSLPSPPKR